MTHRQILMSELAQRGRVTYRDLLKEYGPRGYTRNGFLAAVRRAALKGLVKSPGRSGSYIVLAGCCPCCGRPWEDANAATTT